MDDVWMQKGSQEIMETKLTEHQEIVSGQSSVHFSHLDGHSARRTRLAFLPGLIHV
jgi:hypothetical protein